MIQTRTPFLGLPLLSSGEIATLEAEAIKQLGIPENCLMESAGRCAAQVLFDLSARGQMHLASACVLVVCGSGGNGGDGAVVARYLHNRGVRCELWITAENSRIRPDSLIQLNSAAACGVPIHRSSAEHQTLRARLSGLGSQDVIVDALYGTGVSSKLAQTAAQLVEAINGSSAFVLSLDVPSGLDANFGHPKGSEKAPAIVSADATVTFAFPKIGMSTSPGYLYVGDLFVADIGIPETLLYKHENKDLLATSRVLLPLGRSRQPLSHKGDNGHLLIVAGSPGKTGAALLCTEAALGVGIGLCTVALPEGCDAAPLGTRCPEAMTLGYPNDPQAAATLLLQEARRKKRALLLGPGLAPNDVSGALVACLVEQCPEPMVLDAEALNLLADHHDLLRQRIVGTTVLTPHPGEAARLLKCSVQDIQNDRTQAARQLAQSTQSIVVLKGARSVVARPAQGVSSVVVIPTGNATMGSGGMGDVLAGMIGALLCTGQAASVSAVAASFWHGVAGDRLAQKRPAGVLLKATELIAELDAAKRQTLDDAHEESPWPVRRLSLSPGLRWRGQGLEETHPVFPMPTDAQPRR